MPQEKEEIILDDCKLFIFIITGLFIGFNKNRINNDNSSFNTDRKVMSKNKSLNNFNLSSKIRKKKDSMEKNLSKDKLSQSYTKNKSNGIKIKIKGIENITNMSCMFRDCSSLLNLSDISKWNTNNVTDMSCMTAEKDLTFYPKTNKNNTKLINKFAPSLNFFERSALIKNRNDQKMIIIQRERSQKMMKECTFEPGKQNPKINKLPFKI